MRSKAAGAASSNSTNSVEAVEESNSHAKKQGFSDERFHIGAPMAIVAYNSGEEPDHHHQKGKSCMARNPREKKIHKRTASPEPQGIPTQTAIGPIDHRSRTRKRKATEKIHNGPKPPPQIPNEFKDTIEQMGGTDLQLIIQKGLCKADVRRNNSRLSMPQSQWIADKDLSSQLLMMFENGSDSKNHVSLPLIDTKMRLWGSMSVRMWNLEKPLVVIAGEWNNLVDANELKFKDVVQIWCFKFIETGRLGLVMVKIESGNDSSSLYSAIAMGSKVDDAHASSSAASFMHSDSNQYPSTCYIDFLNVESSQKCVQFAGSESYSVMTTAENEHGGSSTEAILSTGPDTTSSSSSDIDLTLHL